MASGRPNPYVHLEVPDGGPMRGGPVRGGDRDPGAVYPMDAAEESINLHDPRDHVQQQPIQQMVEGAVKLVTMLNFMKVELGEYKTFRSKEQWRATAAEFIATLLFVYLGCGSVVASGMLFKDLDSARLVAIAIAHGLAIVFLAGATGALSGGHINPAVTLAFVVAGKETLLRAAMYVTAQLFGAVIGAGLLAASTPHHLQGSLGSHGLGLDITASQGFLMEIMLTFVLVFVIFGVAVDRRGPGIIAPLPIGFAVLVDHLVGVPFTGASMNPARSFGPALVSGHWAEHHWIYWFGPCIGATLASALYRYVFLQAPPVPIDHIVPKPSNEKIKDAIPI